MAWWLLTFSREGAARYISHLDTARALQRTFARAGIQVRLSEGMRPKPRLSLGLPLPVGAAARSELAAVEIAEDQEPTAAHLKALRAAAPEGLVPQSVEVCAQRPRLEPQVAYYECGLAAAAGAVEAALQWFAGLTAMVVRRETPKAARDVDLKMYIEGTAVRAATDGAVLCFAVRHRADGAARPDEFMSLIAGRAGVEGTARDLVRVGVHYKALPASSSPESGVRTDGRRRE